MCDQNKTLQLCRDNLSVAEHCIDISGTRYQANTSTREDLQAEGPVHLRTRKITYRYNYTLIGINNLVE
jgi:hypothetical protein